MSNVFNSVQGLKPKMRSFSAHSYRNDLTHPAGVIVPVYQQHVTAKTRVLLRTHALVRTMPLVAPIMDNVDYFVHFWQIPYRLLENDKFTEFISGELDDDAVYTGNNWFFSPYDLVKAITDDIYSISSKQFACMFGDVSLFDMLGYDKTLFGWDEDNQEFNLDKASKKRINWRPLIAYLMLMLHWYMNENVPYFPDFVKYCEYCLKIGVCSYSEEDVVTLHPNFLALITDIVQLNYFGSNDSRYCSFMPHAWAKDYFTSALPNVQLGEAAGLPLDISGTASIAPFNALLSGNGESSYPGGPDAIHFSLMNEDGETVPSRLLEILGANGLTSTDSVIDLAVCGDKNLGLPIGDIHDVTLSGVNQQGEAVPISSTIRMDNAGVITINELRFANALQVFKERQLRFGRRRLEYYKGFFDVTPEDLRLQVPRFLGGGRLPINISDVEQTSSSTETSAQGNLAGKGTAVAGGFAGFNTFCSEETIIIGLAFVMPKNTYANGLSRFMLKTDDRYDYFNPSFQHLGEQAITKIELFAGAANPDDEFGYTPRFNEYRFHNNEVHGSFKSTLAYWNLARIFKQAPALNADFIYMKPAYFDRIFNYAGKDPILASLHFSVRLLQPVSKYGTPMLLA